MRLKGKTAIITGAAAGIGAASASLFASEGANVFAVDIDEAKLRKVTEAIGGRRMHPCSSGRQPSY